MRGVLWVRVSSAEQAHGYSPDAQLRELEAAAKEKSIEVVRTIKAAESAKTSSARKQFKDLIAFIEAEKPDVLVAHALDRLTRNPEDLHTLHRLIEKGLKVFVVSQGKIIDKKSSPPDRFTFLLFGDIAYLDNLQRSERVRMGMFEKARQGIYPSRVPVGYLNAPDPKDPLGQRRIVQTDPVKGPLVALAFQLYAKGDYSLAILRDELNKKGLRQKANSKQPNAPMSVHGVEVILHNDFYAGAVRWDKQTFQGTHEPLVPWDLFNRVQARLQANCSHSRPSAKKQFTFKKFLRCGHCHTAVTAELQKGRHERGNYVYYHCSRSKNRHCPLGNFREEKIDAMFAEEMGRLYVDGAIAAKIKARLGELHVEHERGDRKELRRLQAEYTRKTNHLDLVYQDRLDGTISKDDYLRRKVVIEQELRTVQADIEKLGRINRRYKEEGIAIIDLLRGFKRTYQAADSEGKIAILSATVDRAVLRGNELHVFWKQPFETLAILGEGVRTKRSWQGHGDSNPGLMAENHLSWASRRWPRKGQQK
jgi:site-specific DNA recombinase